MELHLCLNRCPSATGTEFQSQLSNQAIYLLIKQFTHKVQGRSCLNENTQVSIEILSN